MLAIAWSWFFFEELFGTLTRLGETAALAIWAAFVFEFSLKLYLAPSWRGYLARNWLSGIGLLIPAVGSFRLLRALRLLQGVPVITTSRFLPL